MILGVYAGNTSANISQKAAMAKQSLCRKLNNASKYTENLKPKAKEN
jgi:hypothetical protein